MGPTGVVGWQIYGDGKQIRFYSTKVILRRLTVVSGHTYLHTRTYPIYLLYTQTHNYRYNKLRALLEMCTLKSCASVCQNG